MAEYTERRESRYDSGVRGHRLQWSSRSEVVRQTPPVRRTPAHTMFARLHQQLCETGSFRRQHVIEIGRHVPLNEEIVLDMVETTPSLSTRGDHLIGPYILPDRLTGPRYLIFLEQVLPELLDSARYRCDSYFHGFQQDGAPAHFSISVRNHLDATCGERWIGRGGPVHWPPRSPDLSCLRFLLGASEILGVRNTRKQRRRTCSKQRREIRNTQKCYRMFDAP
ncbi:uncharacterized protein TNCV_4315751 [Trichonephila clavipes]|nr:uncharacterized protein TNCV_4315751 [Trichonephila clavipes]